MTQQLNRIKNLGKWGNPGSKGFKHSDESKLKMSEKLKLWHQSHESSMKGRKGKDHPLFGYRHSEEQKKKWSNNRSKEKNPNWKGGRYIRKDGYIMIFVGEGRRQRLEQVVIAEKILGRNIKSNECVHHVNGNPGDNRNSNLLICTNSYHFWLHSHMANLYVKEHFGGDKTP